MLDAAHGNGEGGVGDISGDVAADEEFDLVAVEEFEAVGVHFEGEGVFALALVGEPPGAVEGGVGPEGDGEGGEEEGQDEEGGFEVFAHWGTGGLDV
jgi:hypothetical protein